MITEDYVSFETAKLLKEKGFNEPCRGNYYWGFDDKDNSIVEFGEWTAQAYNNDFEDEMFICSAPTLQMAMKWLREVHKLEIFLNLDVIQENHNWWYKIGKYTKGYISILHESGSDYSTYENACEAAIKYCLENLI